MKRIISILLLFCGIALLSQESNAPLDLLKKAEENFELLETNPEKAFLEAKNIEKEAQGINAERAELRAMEIQCVYYRVKNDFKNMMTSANSLFQNAKLYKKPIYQVIAKNYLFESYIFSGLPEKAFEELKQGMDLISRSNGKDSLSIVTKTNLYIAYSNYFLSKKDYENQLKYLKLSGKEFEKLHNKKLIQKFLYIHYSNVAGAYININHFDSAKYYAEFSQSKENENRQDNIEAANLLVLGKVSLEEKNYKQALFYLKKAEQLKGNSNHLNIVELFDNIIESYKYLQQRDSAKLYESKKDSLQLIIAENKNKSLYTLLNEEEEKNSMTYIYVVATVFVAMCIILLIIRKNRILARREKISRKYLEKVSEGPTGEDYSKLLKALKENDPAFMYYFEEIFFGFSSKLLKANPKISSSEIEFCALLKLKIPTKEIARYKFISPKTVLNKKYLVANKLDIPKTVDIYEWFDRF